MRSFIAAALVLQMTCATGWCCLHRSHHPIQWLCWPQDDNTEA